MTRDLVQGAAPGPAKHYLTGQVVLPGEQSAFVGDSRAASSTWFLCCLSLSFFLNLFISSLFLEKAKFRGEPTLTPHRSHPPSSKPFPIFTREKLLRTGGRARHRLWLDIREM